MEHSEAPSLSIKIPQELIEYIDRRIQQAVEAIGSNIANTQKSTTYLTRKQVCKLLAISMPTLISYCDKGILHGQKVGHRILFDEARLKASLQDLPVKRKIR